MSCEHLQVNLENCLAPLVGETGFDLVALDWRSEPLGWMLRLYLDKKNGEVNIDDCEMISRRVENYLDHANLIDHSYILEVSSPGLRRPLKKAEDFERFLGEKVRIDLKQPLQGTVQKVVYAKIQEVAGSNLILQEDGRKLAISINEIAKANLEPEINI